MVSITATLLACLTLLSSVLSAPVELRSTSLESRQTAQSAPHWVLYWDQWVNGENGPPSPSTIYGFNVFILSFLLSTGPADQVLEWTYLSNDTRASIKSEYEAAGIKLMVSAFGATDAPTTNGYDPVSLATTMAQFVLDYNLDGIDIDWEDFTAMNKQNGQAEYWLISFTETLRSILPAGQYIITHAPVAPWFTPGDYYPTGAYTIVNENAGYAIDWYNIQFYNQASPQNDGATEYTNCSSLLYESSTTWPYTALFQLNSVAGVPLEKLVIGVSDLQIEPFLAAKFSRKKPAEPSDASNGWIDPATLATCVKEAVNGGWSAGVMTWEYPDASASWIATVRADSFPV
ncbi:glycoside hydrolase [Dacryopinax primogenitus]|uniref:Glycoside hydrolase n=1 Tax=Dacryopinax primogenitus (strain DJM 731) TaxID=1858805 RepID=M5G9Q7_DACPD|nr:glycoside hydrolase [Dacryopinax primogenitus]EJU05020.1 glycoside hydrolase [Dacryopinax primogenitus]